MLQIESNGFASIPVLLIANNMILPLMELEQQSHSFSKSGHADQIYL